VVQLMHTGRIAHAEVLGAQAVGASAIAAPGRTFTGSAMRDHSTPRALTGAEVEEVVAQYGTAARLAPEAGLDGVEIHGANGYLPNQFLASNVDDRGDQWGGSV
jgi:N-ethylmaleimide reductase